MVSDNVLLDHGDAVAFIEEIKMKTLLMVSLGMFVACGGGDEEPKSAGGDINPGDMAGAAAEMAEGLEAAAEEMAAEIEEELGEVMEDAAEELGAAMEELGAALEGMGQ